MNNSGKISVILPVYNGEKYIRNSITSVLDQGYQNWELIIINDGSKDNTQSIVEEFSDHRILKANQENRGVSAARNKGLDIATGEFICFLDADDQMSNFSLESRLEVFTNSNDTDFVDGSVEIRDSKSEKLIRVWNPSYKGAPFEELIKLSGKVFFGPTWMIRRKVITDIRLKENMTHAEDLLFYIQASIIGRNYDFTNKVILKYRSGHDSAMKNLKGLEIGYKSLFDELSKMDEVSESRIIKSKKKVKYMMVKAYLRNFDLFSAISVYLNK